MKKIAFIFLAISIVLIELVLAKGTDHNLLSDVELTAEEHTWIQDHPNIRLSPDPDFLPLEFIDKSGKYVEIESSEKNPTLIHIPKNIPSAHLNSTNQMSTILTLANVAWKPNDDEMKNITFDEYDWKKWKNI